jgi:multidrug resistance efflux pump
MAENSMLDELELRSEYVQEVLGVVPRWTVRWGITAIFLAIALLLALSWIIHYPDVIPARIVITTPNPPSSIIAQASGKLINIAVRDNHIVASGDLLAVLNNSADAETVFQLRHQLESIRGKAGGPFVSRTADFPENSQLGELQNYYSVFLKHYNEHRFFAELNPIGKEIAAVGVQLAQYRPLLEKLSRQQAILEQEVTLAEKDLRRTRELFQRQMIPPQTLEDKERALLQVKRSLESVQVDAANAQIAVAELEKTRVQLQLRNQQEKKQLELNLTESYENLRSQLSIWEHKYVLRSPISGRVTFFKFWSDYQFVTLGDEVMTIVPDQTQALIGKVQMPVQNSGKVKIGQQVYIRLDNYPYQEFGMLTGVVQSISLVPRNASYAIEVHLPYSLHTSFNKHLDFKQEMQGGAEIITEDLRLLERIFYQIRRLLTNQL